MFTYQDIESLRDDILNLGVSIIDAREDEEIVVIFPRDVIRQFNVFLSQKDKTVPFLLTKESHNHSSS